MRAAESSDSSSRCSLSATVPYLRLIPLEVIARTGLLLHASSIRVMQVGHISLKSGDGVTSLHVESSPLAAIAWAIDERSTELLVSAYMTLLRVATFAKVISQSDGSERPYQMHRPTRMEVRTRVNRRQCFALLLTCYEEPHAMTHDEQKPDLVEQSSDLNVDQAVVRLTEAILSAGMQVFAKIDHGNNANAVGLSMPPAVVLIYGNAKGGTPIMLASPIAALDLPLRVLVREGAGGNAVVAFRNIVPVLRKAGVPEVLAERLAPAQRLLVDAIRP